MAKELTHAPATPPPTQEDNELGTRIATVAAIGLAAALIEVELIPGILIGVGAMLAPKIFPNLGGMLRPLVKGAVRAGYAVVDKTKEMAAEAGEQFQDIVAEVKSEQEPPVAARHTSDSGRA